MVRIKFFGAALALAVSASMVSAHLPSPYDARFGIERERMRMAQENGRARNTVTYSNRGAWSKDATYNGDFANFRGDTVKHGTWNGQDLWWWAKFWSANDEPGGIGTGGGTSPWVMINSISTSQGNGRPNYTWRGFSRGANSGWERVNPQASNPKGYAGALVNPSVAGTAYTQYPFVATWRDGARGAYSFTHDDIGPMPFGLSVNPAYELGKDFPEIKQAWGVFAGRMSDTDWDNALVMVKDGHEMFNHSWDHTSAADQYMWFYNKQKVPDFDPAIPYAIRGLTVKSLWLPNPSTAAAPWEMQGVATGWADKPNTGSGGGITWKLENTTTNIGADCDAQYANDAIRRLTLSDGNITISGPAAWTGLTFNTSQCILGKVPMQVTANSGSVQSINLPSDPTGNTPGSRVWVHYTRQANLSGLPVDGSAMDINNEGTLYATMPGWLDPAQLRNFGENGWEAGTISNTGIGWSTACPPGGINDCGAGGLIASVFTVRAWGNNERTINMKDANDTINQRLFNRITNPGKYFAVGRQSEYYGYPFDAYSLETHGSPDKPTTPSLHTFGILQARGGSKTPVPMLGDFFHPYAIDFDAFWIDRTSWTPAKGSNDGSNDDGPLYVYPGNAHVWLGLNEMVTRIVETSGYMIREFHAVADIPDNQWYSTGQPSNTWALNSSAVGKGGWWGGITKNQLRDHYTYIRSHYDTLGVVVFTPTEAVKYRLTANATTGATWTAQGANFILTPQFNSGAVNARQIDEISFIVDLNTAVSEVNVEYVSPFNVTAASGTSVNITQPRLAPRNLSGTPTSRFWSINADPSRGAVRVIPNQAFNPPAWDGPNLDIVTDGPDDNCNPFVDPDCRPFDPVNPPSGISRTLNRANTIAFTGIQNGQINLRLTSGNYTAQLFNLQGRMVGNVNINAVAGVNTTGLRTDHLAKGMFILNVKNAAGANVLQQRIMVR